MGRWWFPSVPRERLATLRILVGLFAFVYASARVTHFADYSRFQPEQFRPIGIVTLANGPLPGWLCWTLAVGLCLSSLAFLLGWCFRISGPVCASLLLWVLTYRSSWGMVFHTENLLALHVIVLAVAPCADALALDARALDARALDARALDARALDARALAEPAIDAQPSPRYGWPVKLMCAVTASTYCIAGVTKLRATGLDWVTSDLLHNYVAYDAIRKIELGSVHSPLAAALAGHPAAFYLFALLSLVTELIAPLALFGRRIARAWVAAAVLFHAGVLAVMAILFPYPLFGIGFASFFAVEKLSAWLIKSVRKRLRVADA